MDLLSNLRNSVDISALIIATIGAFLSISSALYLTSRRISAEFRYRRVDLTRIYAENLLKKRLEIYPAHWSHLSGYAKVIRGTFFREEKRLEADVCNLFDVYEKINDWNSSNSLVLSENSASASGNLRNTIYLILKCIEENNRVGVLTKEEKDDVLKAIARVEIAMRTDVGISEVDDFERRTVFLSYRELRSNRESKKRGMSRFLRHS